MKPFSLTFPNSAFSSLAFLGFAFSLLLCLVPSAHLLGVQANVRDSLKQELRRAEAQGRTDANTAQVRLRLALWYMAHDQNDTAAMMGYLRAARRDEQRLNDKKITAEWYLAAGNIARRRYRNTEALRLLDTAITLHTELGERNRVAYALSRIGLVFHQQHLYEIALKYHTAALSEAEITGDSATILTQCTNLADLYLRIKQPQEAAAIARRGLHIAQLRHDKAQRGSLLVTYAEILLEQRETSAALAAADTALAITTALGNHDDAQYATMTRGEILQAQEKLDTAYAIFQSVATHELQRFHAISPWTAWHLASVLYEKGVRTQNPRMVREAIALAETTLHTPAVEQHNERLYTVLVKSYLALGDSSAAFRVQRQSLNFQDSLLRLSMATQVTGLRDYYQLQRYHEETALWKQERTFIIVIAIIIFAAATLIAWLQWKRSRLKQRTAALLEERNTELTTLNDNLQQAYTELQQAYDDAATSRQALEQQHITLTQLHREQEERKHLLSEAYNELDHAYQDVMVQQEELATQNTALETLSKEKDELMGIMAHDLKNPLSMIRSYVELSLEPEVGEESKVSFLRSAIQAADRMFHLISSILEVNRLERGGFDLSLQRLSLSPLVESVVDGFKTQAQQKNITLRCQIAPNVTAFADPIATFQIVENLISNAVKYSPQGKNVFVEIKEQGTGNTDVRSVPCCLILVRDEGPGISAKDHQRLFGKFARLSARPTAKESSTGLGLSIVKKLVEAMNGRVWCESDPQSGVAGATFIVELPAEDVSTVSAKKT
jgi:signal transduction histidine kinase